MKNFRSSMLVIVSFFVVCAIPVILFSEQRQEAFAEFVSGQKLAADKPFAILAITTLFAFDIFLPIPSSVVCAVAGRIFGLVLGTFICWVGLNLSAMIGYFLSYYFGWPIVNRFSKEADLLQVKQQVDRWGIWPLVMLRPIPVLSEASILMMGTYRFPQRFFWPPVIVSNLVIAAVFVGIGSWFEGRDLFWLGLLISCLIPTMFLALWIMWQRKSTI